MTYDHFKQDAGVDRVLPPVPRKLQPGHGRGRIAQLFGDRSQPSWVEDDIEDILWCNALIFIYSTWCYGPPAMLERCLLPGGAFDPALWGSDTILRGLAHVTRLGGFTTCDASLALTHMMGSPRKNTFLRGVRALLAVRCKTSFVAHCAMDKSTSSSGAAHLRKVRPKMRILLA